jgi:hypothetical protein
MTEPVPVPRTIACAQCGETLHPLHSYGLSTPVEGRITPADFCDLRCLTGWITDIANAAHRRPS